MTSVWVLADPGDRASVERLVAELVARGVTIAGSGPDLPAGDVDGVVVMLSSRPLPRESLARARGHGDRVVPVSLDGVVHTEFGEANQVMLPVIGHAAAAAQVVAVASTGGRTLARLRELHTSAEEWDRSKRPSSALLGSRDQIDAARGLVAACPPDLASSLAEAYVDESTAHLRRRARLLRGGGAALAVVLVAATVAALALRSTSASAAAQLEREARQETSKRLAGLSRVLLDVDPDLPRIAAAEALDQDPTAEAAAAARGVLVQTLAHRSIALDILPMDVSVGGDVFAVVDVSGRIQVRDLGTGDVRRTVEPTKRVGSVELSLDGAHLAMIGPDEFEVVSTATGELEASGSAAFGIWVGDVLLTVDDGVIATHAVGDDHGSVVLPKVKGELGALAVSSDQSLIATLAGGRVRVDRLDGGGRGWAGKAEGARDVVFAPAGELLVVGPSSLVIGDPSSPDAISAGVDLGNSDSLQPLDGSGIVGRGPDGLFTLVYGYDDDAQTEVVGGRAHLGLVSGVSPIPGGGFATAGGDRFVRLWEQPQLPVYPAGSTDQLIWSRGLPGFREGVRPSLGVSSDGEVLTVSQGSPALVAMVDARTLEPIGARAGSPRYLGDISVRAHPCGDAGVLFVSDEEGTAAVFDATTGDAQVLADTVDVGPETFLYSHVGCSPDGSELVWADNDEVRFHDAGSDSWSATSVDGGGTPLSVLDASTPMSVATRDGGRVDARGTTARITPDGIGAEAAGDSVDRVFIAVGSDGVLYRSSPTSGPEGLGTVSQDLEAYAVRVSPDGRLAAVIGPRNTEIYDTSTGDLFLALDAGTLLLRKSVRDVAFVEDGLVVVSEDGALARYAIPAVGDLADALAPSPRTPTTSEQDLVLGLER